MYFEEKAEKQHWLDWNKQTRVRTSTVSIVSAETTQLSLSPFSPSCSVGLKDLATPVFGIASNASFDNVKYGLEGVSNPSIEQVATFLQDYLDGKLAPSVKSERVADGEEGAVGGFGKVSSRQQRKAKRVQGGMEIKLGSVNVTRRRRAVLHNIMFRFKTASLLCAVRVVLSF